MEQILINEFNVKSTVKKLTKLYNGECGTIIHEFVDAVFEHNRRYPTRPLIIEAGFDPDAGLVINLFTKFRTQEVYVLTCIENYFDNCNRVALFRSIEAFEAGLKIMGRFPRTVKTL
jgi:hypothetical protein